MEAYRVSPEGKGAFGIRGKIVSMIRIGTNVPIRPESCVILLIESGLTPTPHFVGAATSVVSSLYIA